ncbi:hypothetical protein Pmar_PMAR024892 [Perkinsus marinus ATCC 50983]|uniref:Peptidase A2 domain-containing protein n=2 Tax=Perkinsus marinus (strain ATCC 50983 / TXsc) TaxID=423536 RepID=C5LCX6_PERM5|nr:hypothetical protein Pmar_PMAR024892 [Perkinsus marinus ATCC 50983]EER05429.1 hypothetical protein Pmar_PMAR024892 [Perkinsus marinus ATCC 50983]|eukprot:XP_002773613.1 hypothetical protein Pmar_PMAR024892 [Perkinsus marinus ATCC 50983]
MVEGVTNVVFKLDLTVIPLEATTPINRSKTASDMTFHIQQIAKDTLRFDRSGPVCTELIIGSGSNSRTIKAVLDSGAGYNYAKPDILQALGSAVQWLKPDGNHAIRAVGVSGEVMPASKVALVSVCSPRRPHDVHKLRILCPDTLLPNMLLGVEGLKSLHIGMTFTESLSAPKVFVFIVVWIQLKPSSG